MAALLRWLASVALAAALFHLGLTYWNRSLPSPAAANPAPGIAPELSGSSLKILAFYASPPAIHAGDPVSLCFGVLNASSVHIEPGDMDLRPAISRCLEANPTETTTFTLTATGRDGDALTEQFTLPVSPAPARFIFAETSQRRIRRGEPFSVCYGVRHATRVALLPIAPSLPPLEKFCYRFYPPVSTRFTLTATGPGGPADPLRFGVTLIN